MWKNFTAPLRINASSPLRLCSTLAVTAAVFFSGAPGQAQVIFSDNFDANTPVFNTVPIGWTNANAGRVDIIGVCSGFGPLIDVFPGNGCYIDLDGSTGAAGKLKKVSLSLEVLRMSFHLIWGQPKITVCLSPSETLLLSLAFSE